MKAKELAEALMEHPEYDVYLIKDDEESRLRFFEKVDQMWTCDSSLNLGHLYEKPVDGFIIE